MIGSSARIVVTKKYHSFGLMYNSRSICSKQEFGAKIGSVDLDNGQSVVILGSLAKGSYRGGSVNPDNSDLHGTQIVGFMHTHGNHPKKGGGHYNNFSGSGGEASDLMGVLTSAQGGDMDWANENNVPIFLANPRGHLKVYYPKKGGHKQGDGIGITLRKDMPFDWRAGTDDPAFNGFDGFKGGRPAYDKSKFNSFLGPNDAIEYKTPEQ